MKTFEDFLTNSSHKEIYKENSFLINKELFGSFVAKVRALKEPEPYKGKGFRYSDEIIRRKQGKKSV